MPLFRVVQVDTTSAIYIWKIEEPLAYLQNIKLTESCKFRLSKLAHELHKKQFLSVRHLLEIANLPFGDLYYDSLGIPKLRDERKISITHSGLFSAVFIGDEKLGIDIERKKNKILNLASKFEKVLVSGFTENQMIYYYTALWCIKESVYKAFSQKGVSFKNHIEVCYALEYPDRASAFAHFGGIVENYRAHVFELEDYICSYAIKV